MKKFGLFICLCALCYCACQPQGLHAQQNPKQKESKSIVLSQLYGKSVDITALRAQKPVLVAFMATYCGYCKKMTPYIEALADKYRDGSVFVAVVLVEDDLDDARQFAEKQSIQHASVLYGGGRFSMQMGVRGFPHIVLFDNKSDGVYRWNGYSPNHAQAISEQIDYLLKKEKL